MSASNNEVGTAFGNTWVICKSKSYSGRNYYFNTLTGEALWNLCEAEIDKAKNATKLLEKHCSFKNDKFPEPSESPKDLQDTDKIKIPHFSSVSPQVCNNAPSHPKCFSDHQTINCNSQNSLPLEISSISPLCNFSSRPLQLTNVKQTHSVIQFNDTIPVSRTSIDMSSRFGISMVSSNGLEQGTKFLSSQMNPEKSCNISTFENSMYSLPRESQIKNYEDLRVKLFFGKRKILKTTSEYNFFNENNDSRDTEHDSKSISHKEPNNMIYCSEDQRNETNMEGSLINISSLRRLISYDEENIIQWFLVTDSSILLNDIGFLKMLLSLDEQCQLVVPQVVMNDIEAATKSNMRTEAHKAAFFVLQQVDCGSAFIDSVRESFDNKQAIVDCCSRLSQQGPVILLSNDDAILKMQVTVNIHILSVNKIKKICSISPLQQKTDESPNISKFIEERRIKITIPNLGRKLLSHENHDLHNEIMKMNKLNNQVRKITIPKESKKLLNPEISDKLLRSENNDLDREYMQIDTLNYQVRKNINSHENVTANEVKDAVLNLVTLNNIKKDCQDMSTSVCNRQNRTGKPKIKRIRHNVSSIANVNNPIIERKYLKKCRNDNTLTECIKFNQDLELDDFKQESQSNCRENSEASILDDSQVNKNAIAKKDNFKSIDMKYWPNNYTTGDPSKKDHNQNNARKDTGNQGNVNVNEKDVDDNNVMFEVTGKIMEDNLIIRRDEWVSRFVQIMEEVLSQVLRQDPIYVLDAMPPPWTLYEATECVKRKFIIDCDILDAASKLLNVLFEMGGLRGNITHFITPQNYMKMYSYGVYLIDALQCVLSNNEDLQIATKSLSKLLHDIQQTNLDRSNHDMSFGNISAETNNFTDANIDAGKSRCIDNTSPIYKKEVLEKEKSRSSSFSLPLLTREITTGLENKKSTTNTINHSGEKSIINEDERVSREPSEVKSNELLVNKIHELSGQKQVDPKIVRTFTKFFEIEERLKNRFNEKDVEQFFEPAEDYSSLDEESEYDSQAHIDCDQYYNYSDGEESNNECESNNKLAASSIEMRCFIQNFVTNTKTTFTTIDRFCHETISLISSEKLASVKNQLIERFKEAEKADSHVAKICLLLESILKRETNYSTLSLNKIMKDLSMGDDDLSREELVDFRNVVRISIEQGNLLRNTLKLIIQAIDLINES